VVGCYCLDRPDCWCLPVLPCVYRYFPVFTGISLCLPVFPCVYRYCPVFTGIALCLPVFWKIKKFRESNQNKPLLPDRSSQPPSLRLAKLPWQAFPKESRVYLRGLRDAQAG